MSAPRKCKVCRHPQVEEINKDLLGRLSIRKTAKKYSMNTATIQKHKTMCMARDFEELIDMYQRERDSIEAEGAVAVMQDRVSTILSGVGLINQIDEVIKEAEDIRSNAMDTERIGVAVSALNTKLKAIDSFSKVAAEAREREKMKAEQTVQDWNALRDVLRRVLSHYPGALEEFERESANIRSSTFS